jgi:hypothetical protein
MRLEVPLVVAVDEVVVWVLVTVVVLVVEEVLVLDEPNW